MFGSLSSLFARLYLRRGSLVLVTMALMGWLIGSPLLEARGAGWRGMHNNSLRTFALALRFYNEYYGSQCEEPPCPECEKNKEDANSEDADDDKQDGDRGGVVAEETISRRAKKKTVAIVRK